MKNILKISSIAFFALSALVFTSCDNKQTEPSFQPETILGSFEYNGNTYNIRSVVVYELGNDTQLWISETAGYKTVDEIERSAGELVITIPNSKLGGNKVTFEQKGGFIRYDDKENSGLCLISCSIDKTSRNVSFEFSSQYLKAQASNAISGKYSGPYSVYSETEISNQWAYNRKAVDVTAAEYVEMEDGSPSHIILYDGNGEGVEITVDPANLGKTLTISTSNVPKGTSVLFDNGEEFKLAGGYGSIKATLENSTLKLSMKLTNEGGKTLRAEYEGPYTKSYSNKYDRCIYDSGSEGYGYNGRFAIKGLKVIDGSMITLIFSPGEGEGSTLVDGNLVPTLKIPREFVNAGTVDLCQTDETWSFAYHQFQVYSFDPSNPDKNTAENGSRMNVSKDNSGNWIIDLYIVCNIDKMVSQDKKDENGNIVYEDVIKTDSFGNPVYDSNGDFVYEKVPVKEIVTVKVPTSIDIFYSSSDSNAK